MVRKKYDAIVIGGGIGGISIGSLLSKNMKVLILEKNGTFGGYCSDFKKGEFEFESAVQTINGLYKDNPVYTILEKAHALKGIKITRPEYLYRTIFPDYDITVPQKNLDGYKRMLFSLFPKEEENITAIFDVMKSLYAEMKRFHVEKSLKRSPFILKYGRRSLKYLLNRFIKDDKLKAIISQYWLYRGLPPGKLAATTFAYIWYDYTVNGSYFPDTGMVTIIKNMISFIKKNGSDVLGDSEVFKLQAKGDKIEAVELKNGDRLEADIFISNIDVFNTFEMIENGNDDDIKLFLDRLKKNTISISAFKIYLGLNIDVRDLGIKDYEIFLNPRYDMDAMYEASIKNEFEKTPYIITIYSNLTNVFCKKGHSVISIGALSGYDYWRNLSRAEYAKKKEDAIDIILKRCSKILPDIYKYIDVKIAATPLTMERHTGNSKGSVYGWSKRSLLEEIKFMSSTTPIKNLFLSSHWTKIGGGVAGVLLSTDRVYNLLNQKEQ